MDFSLADLLRGIYPGSRGADLSLTEEYEAWKAEIRERFELSDRQYCEVMQTICDRLGF